MSSYTAKQIGEASERLLDYYKDGEYSYDEFREEFPGDPIPGKYRVQKTLMKKILEDLIQGKAPGSEGVEAICSLVFYDDPTLVRKREAERKSLKNEIKSLKELNKQLETSAKIEEDMMEKQYEREIKKELMESDIGQELQRWKKRERERYADECRKINENRLMIQKHDIEKRELQEHIVELTLLKNERFEKEQKENDKKYKKKYKQLQIKYDKLLKSTKDDSDATSSDDD